jgi:L-asparaginase
MKIDILTAGGTIDKIYFDKKSEYEVGDPVVGPLLESMNVGFDFNVEQLMKIDSLDMTEEHRNIIYGRVNASTSKHVLITHGTDGMIETGKVLTGIKNKTIVLTGALQPAAFAHNDAVFNIGCSVTAIQCLPVGVYIVMNGEIFTPDNVTKNLKENRFERN